MSGRESSPGFPFLRRFLRRNRGTEVPEYEHSAHALAEMLVKTYQHLGETEKMYEGTTQNYKLHWNFLRFNYGEHHTASIDHMEEVFAKIGDLRNGKLEILKNNGEEITRFKLHRQPFKDIDPNIELYGFLQEILLLRIANKLESGNKRSVENLAYDETVLMDQDFNLRTHYRSRGKPGDELEAFFAAYLITHAEKSDGSRTKKPSLLLPRR